MNIFYTLFFILWIIRDSVICMPLWLYPYQNAEYSQNSNNGFIVSNPRNFDSEWNQWPVDIPPAEYIYEGTRTLYNPVADLRSFFIPSVPILPISHQVPVPFIVANEWTSSQGSFYNYAEPVSKATTSRSTGFRITTTNIPRKTSTSSNSVNINGRGKKGITVSRPITVQSTTDDGRRYDRNISNSTKSSVRPEISTGGGFVKKIEISLKAKQNNSNFDIFKSKFRNETTSGDKIEPKSSTPRDASKFVSSTFSILYTSPVSSSISPSTIESIDSRNLNFEANDTDSNFNEEPTTEAIFTRNSTESYQIPVSSNFENKLEIGTFKIDDVGLVTTAPSFVQSNTSDFEVSMKSLTLDSTTEAIFTRNFTESYQIPVSSTFENKLENDTFKIEDVGLVTTVPSFVQSNTSGIEVSMKISTVDSTTETGSFETDSFVFQPPVENVTVGLKSFEPDTIINETTKTPEEIVTDYIPTPINLYNLNVSNFIIKIDNEDRNQSTTDVLSTSSTIIPSLSLIIETDITRKLTIDSNLSETIEQNEPFSTSAITTISPINTDELVFETTSISTDNQSFVDNLQLSSTISSNNATDLIFETNDHIESITDVPDPVSYTDGIPSDSKVTIDDDIKFTCEYGPSETSTEYGFDLMEATSPQNIENFNVSSNSSEIKTRVKREEITNDLETTQNPTETVRFEVVTFTNMAKDSNSKLDIDGNDREEYIFNVTASRSHSKGL